MGIYGQVVLYRLSHPSFCLRGLFCRHSFQSKLSLQKQPVEQRVSCGHGHFAGLGEASGGLTLTLSAGSACSAASGEGDQQKTELKCEIGLGGKAPDLLHCGDKWGIKLGPYLSVHKCKGELLFRNKATLRPAPAEVLLCLLIGLLKCYRAQKW